MEPDTRRTANELVLADGEFVYTQDTTSGVVRVYTGPIVVNVTGQENPVVFDAVSGRFQRVGLTEAVQVSPLAAQGHYVELWNPSEDAKHPSPKDKQVSPPLRIGERINIPGPRSFSLWPRQHAKVIPGHQLALNEYLVVRVYDEKAAREAWTTAVVRPAAASQGADSEPEEKKPKGKPKATTDQPSSILAAVPEDLSVGRQFVIRGVDVSFYMPPTGVEVVLDDSGQFVRPALTLERLEYAILVDQSGSKRYVRGPEVVFPTPTERFFEDKQGNRGFAPIELNPIQGVHIKVIAPYTDEDGTNHHSEGEEMFLTGDRHPIYFPRPEHSLVSYDGSHKHFATAVPAGEGRYILDRITGAIRTEVGPAMLLPDPRKEVVVRRVLSDRQCGQWYPGNADALTYNQGLRAVSAASPTTRGGAVTEGELTRSAKRGVAAQAISLASAPAYMAAAIGGTAMDRSMVHADAPVVMGDEFERKSTYTEPRTVTLHTRFAGVPAIEVWSGYAVMVVSSSGERRAEVGPKRVLLGYDESLETLSLSTGRPKTTDKLYSTVYLRVKSNQVGDVVHVETSDHVRVAVKVSYRVDFEGEPSTWFDVDNYVKLLTDHARSKLKGAVRLLPIQEFFKASEAQVRNAVLGAKGADGKRAGMAFPENGMRVTDVEVLGIEIGDKGIGNVLAGAEHEAVRAAVQIESMRKGLDVEKDRLTIEGEALDAKDALAKKQAELRQTQMTREREIALATHKNEMEALAEQSKEAEATAAINKAQTEAEAERAKLVEAIRAAVEQARISEELARTMATTDAIVARFNAAQGGFSEALLALSNAQTLEKVAEALSVQRIVGGKDAVTVLKDIFKGTPLEAIMANVIQKAMPNGKTASQEATT